MKRIRSRTAEKEWQHRFSNSTPSVAIETSSQIWPNFELIQAFMHVLIAGKYEKDQMQNVMTAFISLIFSDAQGQLTPWSMVGSR